MLMGQAQSASVPASPMRSAVAMAAEPDSKKKSKKQKGKESKEAESLSHSLDTSVVLSPSFISDLISCFG